MTFALNWPFQRDCGTAAGRLCHAFSDFSCDNVKLVQDMEKITTVVSGRERCWNQFLQQNKYFQRRQAKKRLPQITEMERRWQAPVLAPHRSQSSVFEGMMKEGTIRERFEMG